jgi:transposase
LPGKYETYSPEFRDEAARLVVETSRPIADVARELSISETSLGNWVRVYREKHAEDEPPLQLSERARLRAACPGPRRPSGITSLPRSRPPGRGAGLLTTTM